MVRITKTKSRDYKQETHDDLEKVDSYFIKANQDLRGLKDRFVNKRDIKLIDKLCKNAEWCANKTLLLLGRMSVYELGTSIFYGKDYFQFMVRRPRNLDYSKKQYVPLSDTKYRGKRFIEFLNKPDLGALAELCKIRGTDREVVLSVLIPKKHKDKIKYE